MAGVPEDVGQVLVQRAAEGDVEDLRPAADPQNRHVPAQRTGHQREFPGVAVAGRLVGGRVGVVAVGGGVDVLAAGDEQTVEAVEHASGDLAVDGLRRQQRRDAAGQGDALDVDAGQEAGVHVPHAGLCLLQIGRQADHRSSRRKGLRHAALRGAFASARRETRVAQIRAPSPSRSPRS